MEIVKDGNVSIIKLPNFFNYEFVKEFAEIAKGLLNEETNPSLVVDFSDTSGIGSGGIGILVELARDFKLKGSYFSLKNLPEEIEELFIDTGLDKIFDIENETGMHRAAVDLFTISADIKLEISKEIRGDVCIFHLIGVMNHPVGSRYFRQQFLLALADYKKILLNFEELTFFDSLSVSVVLAMNDLLKKTGGSLRISETNFIVEDLFNMLNINQIIDCYDSTERALLNWNV